MKSTYWSTDKIKLVSEKKKYAKRKWEEYFDIEARMQLQHLIELPPISYKEYEKKFEDCSELNPYGDSFTLYAENNDDEFVGWISVQDIDRKNGTFSMGGGIFKDFQRNGYGTDCLKLVLRYCFNEMRLNKCNLECTDTNISSFKTQKKLGFIEEGKRRQSVYINGKYHDVLILGITKDEFIY